MHVLMRTSIILECTSSAGIKEDEFTPQKLSHIIIMLSGPRLGSWWGHECRVCVGGIQASPSKFWVMARGHAPDMAPERGEPEGRAVCVLGFVGPDGYPGVFGRGRRPRA